MHPLYRRRRRFGSVTPLQLPDPPPGYVFLTDNAGRQLTGGVGIAGLTDVYLTVVGA